MHIDSRLIWTFPASPLSLACWVKYWNGLPSFMPRLDKPPLKTWRRYIFSSTVPQLISLLDLHGEHPSNLLFYCKGHQTQGTRFLTVVLRQPDDRKRPLPSRLREAALPVIRALPVIAQTDAEQD